MILRIGNLTVKEFAEQVGADMTDAEIEFLESHRTDTASFSDQAKFHIFNDPAISIVIGEDALALTVDTWKAADARKKFNRPVTFYPAAKEKR